MSIGTRILEDFDRARRRAFWRYVGSRLARRDNALLAFDEVRSRLRAGYQYHAGQQTVPIDRIVGSVGRYREFDRAFLPVQNKTRGRWLSIDRAYYELTPLPPIELYQLGETYFVKDGNHRVSVAREQGQEFIDADVIKLHTPVPVVSLAELEEWIRRCDEVEFMACTSLLALRPEARIELTLPGQYEKLLQHIHVHRWFTGQQRRQPVSWEDGVTSWYDHVYADVVSIVRSADVLREFPGRTEADLYLWLIEHCWFLQEAGELDQPTPPEDVVREYARAFSPRPTRRLARLAQRISQLIAA